MNLYIRKKLFDLNHVRFRLYGALGTQHANLPGLGILANNFGSRPDHAQHSFVWIFIFQVYLLNITQRLSRSRITGQYDQRTSLLKQPLNAFPGEKKKKKE